MNHDDTTVWLPHGGVFQPPPPQMAAPLPVERYVAPTPPQMAVQAVPLRWWEKITPFWYTALTGAVLVLAGSKLGHPEVGWVLSIAYALYVMVRGWL